jgi:hypothetical protein
MDHKGAFVDQNAPPEGIGHTATHARSDSRPKQRYFGAASSYIGTILVLLCTRFAQFVGPAE